jgi:hypothetical protein
MMVVWFHSLGWSTWTLLHRSIAAFAAASAILLKLIQQRANVNRAFSSAGSIQNKLMVVSCGRQVCCSTRTNRTQNTRTGGPVALIDQPSLSLLGLVARLRSQTAVSHLSLVSFHRAITNAAPGVVTILKPALTSPRAPPAYRPMGGFPSRPSSRSSSRRSSRSARVYVSILELPEQIDMSKPLTPEQRKQIRARCATFPPHGELSDDESLDHQRASDPVRMRTPHRRASLQLRSPCR